MIRLRAGWLIPQQILALTHFLPEVTTEDFAQITQDTEHAISQVDGEFHLIVDNRIIDNTDLAPLEMMLQFMPQLNHPQLRWMVMVLPNALSGQAQQMETEHHNQIGLKHVDTLPFAFDFLQSVDATINWSAQDKTFFTQ